jgi:phospholipid-binding lipoprotein MlaA
VDTVASPWFWFGQGEVVQALRWTRFGLTVLDAREGVLDVLDEVMRSSLDPYSTIRSGYRQRRVNDIANRDTARRPRPAPASASVPARSAPARRPIRRSAEPTHP